MKIPQSVIDWLKSKLNKILSYWHLVAAWINGDLDWIRFIKKVRIEIIIVLVLVILSLILMPRAALYGLLSLLAAKTLTLVLGTTLAHLLRIIAFHYLSLEELIETDKWPGVLFLAAWYLGVLYCVAVGG